MTVYDDIAAVHADGTKTARQKDVDIGYLKVSALVDIANNGKPPPNPVPPVVGREFTLDGVTYLLHACVLMTKPTVVGDVISTLYLDLTITRPPALPVRHQYYIDNLPVMPISATGNEKGDLMQAAVELIAVLPG